MSSASMCRETAVVADIGGTNARFSCFDVKNRRLHNIAVYPTSKFSNILEAFQTYKQAHQLCVVRDLVIALACPVQNDWVQLTNSHWRFSIQDIKEQLHLNQLWVLNDFKAAALSIPVLSKHKSIQVGPGQRNVNSPTVLLGPGTGLGISYLIPNQDVCIPLASEAGHMTWSAQTEQEWFVQRFLAKQYGHVSSERVLSGAGLEALYLALGSYHGLDIQPLSAAEITATALRESSSLEHKTALQFLKSLGSFAGDLALSMQAYGGVYIAGGIIPKLLPLVSQSEFRTRFEGKGRHGVINQKIATYIVIEEHLGLLGAAMFLTQQKEATS